MRQPTQIISTATINRSIEDVFDYGTTARHWPEWHPTAAAVSGATERSLSEGEQVLEQEKFVFLKGQIRWKMHKRSVPTLWILDGILENIPIFHGTRVTITYTLTAQSGMTVLTRDMAYRAPNAVAKFLDAIFFRHHNTRQSQRAVDRLKKALENRGR